MICQHTIPALVLVCAAGLLSLTAAPAAGAEPPLQQRVVREIIA